MEARTVKNQLLIKIENSYNGCLSIQNGEYISTKNDKSHGLGMKNIKKVIESYRGFVKTEQTRDVFAFMAAFPVEEKNTEKEKN